MSETQLREILNDKIENGDFTTSDIPDYFTVICQLGDEIEDLKDEVEDWDRKIQFVIQGFGNHWLSIQDGEFSTGEGEIEDPNLTLILAVDEAARIFSGEKDAEAAFMSGALKVQGDLPDAIKLHALIEIVLEEIEYS